VTVNLSPELEARVQEFIARNGSEDLAALVEDTIREFLDHVVVDLDALGPSAE